MTDKNVSFDSLKINQTIADKVIKINNKEIYVKQYLPVNDKLKLINRILNLVSENKYSFVNPIQLDVLAIVEIIKSYTNISFDDEMLPNEIYDELENEGIANIVISVIPASEYDFITAGIQDTVNAYYNYKNSVLGILEAATQDYSNLKFDAESIKEDLGNPENLSLLKAVVDKLG